MHLTQAQRYEIAALLKTNTPQKKIAEVIGVHPSTICREIKRNLTPAGNYSPTQAQMFAKERQDWKNKARAKLTNAMKADIVQCIVEHKWSPEQIAGRRKLEGKPMVGKTSIYKFLHQDKKAGGKLYKHTRHGLAYRKRRLAVPIKTDWPKRKSIETRPKCIDQKERVGDFEMDTIIGKEQKGAILTLVERVTGFTIIRLLEHGKDAKALAREVNKALRYYKKMGLLHSITTDNGSEFAKFKTIERSLKTPVYFAHPYQSWDKPHIEYLNKLLRQFIPKSSTFEDLTDADLRRFQNLLNNRPRKNLNYKTPNEVIKNIILEKLH